MKKKYILVISAIILISMLVCCFVITDGRKLTESKLAGKWTISHAEYFTGKDTYVFGEDLNVVFEFFEDHTLKIYTTKQVYNGVWQLSEKGNTSAVIKLESSTYFIQFPAKYKKLHNKESLCVTVENPDLFNLIPDELIKDGYFIDLILKKT